MIRSDGWRGDCYAGKSPAFVELTTAPFVAKRQIVRDRAAFVRSQLSIRPIDDLHVGFQRYRQGCMI